MPILGKTKRDITKRAREVIAARDPAEWRPKTEQQLLNDLAECNADIRETETLIRNLLKNADEAENLDSRAYFLKLLAETEGILERMKVSRRECAVLVGLNDLYP